MKSKSAQALISSSDDLSHLATVYGCCGLFDLCSDQDLMSLSFDSQNKFLDWIGWEKSDVCIIKKNFITWIRAEEAEAGTASHGWLDGHCDDSYGVDFGVCDFTLEDFALLRRHGPERVATRSEVRLCDLQPRYRLDGSPIKNDAEFDMRLALEVILQDLRLMVVEGAITTKGQFDGLEALVKTGYKNSKGQPCHSMDSMVIDWAGNALAGGAGTTWNGVGFTGYDLVDAILAIVRRIKDRIALSPALSAQPLSVGDIIIVAPSHLLRCLLDQYTCWSVCPGSENVIVSIQSYEARTFRNTLNGGMFGFGKIYVDGMEIPLLAYDWGLTDPATGLADMYVLTGNVGNVKTISGQYLDLSAAPKNYPEGNYSYTDGGKLLTWLNKLQTCVVREVEMQPRLLMWAPWAQARIQDISCTALGGRLSGNPFSPDFPETSFSSAECPDGGQGRIQGN
jgi:hypothetical protein